MSTIERPPTKLVLEDGMIDPDTGLPYIEYPGEYDEVGESPKQNILSAYLAAVLSQMLSASKYTILGDIPIYRTAKDKYPLAPDVAVFPLPFDMKKLPGRARWLLTEPNRPVPTVVIEISSYSTWGTDIKLHKKPTDYQNLGVKEYFAYDPNDPQAWDVEETRLLGWKYVNKVRQDIEPNDKGWLWSDELDSWLVPDGDFLRLYDRDERMRLTKEEAATEARLAEEKARKDAEKALKTAESALKTTENALKTEEDARKSAEEAQKKLEQQLAELKEMLRKQGIEPPNI